jgi:thiol:disulfide interchange protein DsbC
MIKILFLITTLLSSNAFADKDDVIKQLGKFFGKIEKQDIVKSPFKGVYEVITSNPIDSVLVSEDGKYLIQGDVIDLNNKSLIKKSNKIKDLKLTLINSIEDKDKIIYSAKNEKYTINVFTDVDCPFCKKLHRNMSKMNDLGITVKYLASPLASLHPTAQGKMQKIWCADDRNQAMDDYKINNITPDVEDCKNPVAEQLKLSQKIGVNGTPAIFLSDGTPLPGYMPADKLLAKIKSSIGK